MICMQPRPQSLSQCAFTPARNGYFLVSVTNDGPAAQTYRLLSN
jgi:hypothetical protein